MEQPQDMMPSRNSAAVPNPLQKLRATCDACNQAKVKCSKNKPSCSRCTSHDIPCVYGISRAGKHRRPSKASKSISGNPLLSPFQHQFVFENIQSSDIPYDENIFFTGPYSLDQTSASPGLDSSITASARTSGDYSDFSIDNLNEWNTTSYTSNPPNYLVAEVPAVPQELYIDQIHGDWQPAVTHISPLGYGQDATISVNGIATYSTIDNTPYHSDGASNSAPASPASYLTSPTIQTAPDVFEPCSCYQTIIRGVQLLQSINFPLSDLVIEYAIDREKDANVICGAVLDCSCSFRSDKSHVLLLASLLAKSITTIQAIYVFLRTAYNSDSMNGMDVYTSHTGNRQTRGVSFDECSTSAITGYGYGQQTIEEPKIQMVLMELKRIETLVYQFVQKFLQSLRIRQGQLGVGQDSVLEEELRTYESVSLHLQTKLGEVTSLVIMSDEGQSTLLG